MEDDADSLFVTLDPEAYARVEVPTDEEIQEAFRAARREPEAGARPGPGSALRYR